MKHPLTIIHPLNTSYLSKVLDKQEKDPSQPECAGEDLFSESCHKSTSKKQCRSRNFVNMSSFRLKFLVLKSSRSKLCSDGGVSVYSHHTVTCSTTCPTPPCKPPLCSIRDSLKRHNCTLVILTYTG